MFGRKNYVTKCDLDYTEFKKRNVIEVACEVLMDNNLADPDVFPGTERIFKIQKSFGELRGWTTIRMGISRFTRCN